MHEWFCWLNKKNLRTLKERNSWTSFLLFYLKTLLQPITKNSIQKWKKVRTIFRVLQFECLKHHVESKIVQFWCKRLAKWNPFDAGYFYAEVSRVQKMHFTDGRKSIENWKVQGQEYITKQEYVSKKKEFVFHFISDFLQLSTKCLVALQT